MGGLTLIKNASDWQLYMRTVSDEYGVPAGMIAWGKGPDSFPCLAASIMAESKLRSCYVYLEDAISLVRAAGAQVIAPGAVASSVAPGSTLPSDWMKHVSANIRALVHELLSVKITTEDRYETVLAKFLADVDQEHAETKDRLTERLFGKEDDQCRGK